MDTPVLIISVEIGHVHVEDAPLVLRSTRSLGATTSSVSISLSDRLSDSSSDQGFFFGFLVAGLN